MSSIRRGLFASTAVLGLLASYALPAYGNSAVNPLPAGATSQVTQSVALEVASITPVAATRDGYSVTVKPKPVSNPYANISNTFANNPNNLVIQWPFSQGVPIASGFGPRAAPCHGCSSFHEGLDLIPGAGTPIQAIADGTVSDLGDPKGSFGVYVMIDHVIDGQRVSSLYGHMQMGSMTVAIGDPIKKGQIIGKVGSTGASSGAHLHLGILLDGVTAIDPYAYLRAKVGS